MKIWIIGAGKIAQEYGKIVEALGYEYDVIGRGENNTIKYKEATGKNAISGGLSAFLATNPIAADKAIVATNLKSLSQNTIELIEYGVKEILCEKPGFLCPEECGSVVSMAHKYNAKVYIAYNRRFFSSVIKAKEIIDEDGGVKSFNFEFTEWGHVIEAHNKSKEELENWMYANSSHIIDLAFYLGGTPVEMSCNTAGELSWHKPAVFAGAGATDNGALFTYSANWASPGRWRVEVLTSKHRLYLCPIEQLQIQNIGSVVISPVTIDDDLDKRYKPGFYLETKKFIEGDVSGLCSVDTQWEHTLNIYHKIINN